MHVRKHYKLLRVFFCINTSRNRTPQAICFNRICAPGLVGFSSEIYIGESIRLELQKDVRGLHVLRSGWRGNLDDPMTWFA